MVKRFSVRNKFYSINNKNDCTCTTKTRLWYIFHKIFNMDHLDLDDAYYDIVEDVLEYLGQEYYRDNVVSDHNANIEMLKRYIIYECNWFIVYDFIEFVLLHADDEHKKEFVAQVNEALEDEMTGLHIVGNYVVPIFNTAETHEIEEAINTCPIHVVESIQKSLKLFSQRPNPDYNNAVKEIITATEALCCTIVNESGIDGVETMGRAVDKLSECGIILNEYLKDGIKKLYKYTCNENGTRHGGITYVQLSVEDARFMIVTCSAILNFLMVKWEKAKENSHESNFN